MFITSDPAALTRRPRVVALGTFDGLHTGHHSLIRRTWIDGLVPTVVTFDPHPRRVLGREVQLISSLSRRLELLAATEVHDVLTVVFTEAMSRLTPREWAEEVLRPIGTRRVVVGENFRFGHRAAGDAATLRRMVFDVDVVPLAGGASSSRIRELVRDGELGTAAGLLGRPCEVEGTVLPGGRPDLLSLVVEPGLLLPPSGTYAGWALGRPAQVTIDTAAGVGSTCGSPLPCRPCIPRRCGRSCPPQKPRRPIAVHRHGEARPRRCSPQNLAQGWHYDRTSARRRRARESPRQLGTTRPAT